MKALAPSSLRFAPCASPRFLRNRWFRFAVLLALPAVSGCSQLVRPSPANQTVTREELQDLLNQSQDSFEAVIRRACDTISAGDPSRRVRRLTLIWQMRVVPMSRNVLDQANPLASLLDLWTLCVRQRLFLTEGDGKELFGAFQEIAVAAARECESESERIAAMVMPPEMHEQTRARVAGVAAAHPFRGEFSGSEVRASLADEQDTVLQSVLAIPLAPFRWLGGVDESAQAIRGFTVVAARLTDVVQGVAVDARLQLQLLLLETEDLETVRQALESTQKVADSSEKFASTAEALPGRLREELTASFDEVDRRQENVQKSLRETRVLVEQLQPAGDAVARAGESWAGTAKAIEEMVASFRTAASTEDGSSRHPPTSDSGGAIIDDASARGGGGEPAPYDVNDYRRAAEALTQTAVELQKLVAELQGLAESTALAERLAEISRESDVLIGRSRSAAEQATNHAAWRGFQVAVAVLVIIAVYRIVTARFVRKGE